MYMFYFDKILILIQNLVFQFAFQSVGWDILGEKVVKIENLDKNDLILNENHRVNIH